MRPSDLLATIDINLRLFGVMRTPLLPFDGESLFRAGMFKLPSLTRSRSRTGSLDFNLFSFRFIGGIVDEVKSEFCFPSVVKFLLGVSLVAFDAIEDGFLLFSGAYASLFLTAVIGSPYCKLYARIARCLASV